jgi:hypothetical protein
MSLCINNDLIWVSVPRCASHSIEDAFLNSPVSINHFKYENNRTYTEHVHMNLSELYKKFGKKETIAIKRNYFERWISGLQHMFLSYEMNNIKLSRKWEEVDNDFIYQYFSKEYIDSIHTFNPADLNLSNYKDTIEIKEILKLNLFNFKDSSTEINFEDLDVQFSPYMLLLSQMYWVSNNKCTYEFDITEIDKFEKFISTRYDIEFKIEKLNQSVPMKNNIIKDDKLKKWVFDNFEKRFVSRNELL